MHVLHCRVASASSRVGLAPKPFREGQAPCQAELAYRGMADDAQPLVAVLDIAPFLAATSSSEKADAGSLGDAASAVVEQWRTAMRDTGLAVVTGHGIEDHIFEALHSTAGQFFDMSNEDKNQSFFIGMSQAMMRGAGGAMDSSGCRWTWKRLNAPKNGWNGEGGGDGTPGRSTASSDSVELVSFHNDPADIVPAQPSDFREKIDAAYAAGTNLSSRLMSLCAAALGVPLDFFKTSYTRPDCTLRIAYYPHVEPDCSVGSTRGSSQPQQRLRYGEHVDFTALTIVRADSASGGLEVELCDGSWSAVPKLPGALVVNAGDLLHRWTNGRWKAALHRVACPTEPEHEVEPEPEPAVAKIETGPAVEQELVQDISRSSDSPEKPAPDAKKNSTLKESCESATRAPSTSPAPDDGLSKTIANNEAESPTSSLQPVTCMPSSSSPGSMSGRTEDTIYNASAAAAGGVDYDALILAAKTDAQRASYRKMKAKAEGRGMRRQIEMLYSNHNPAKLPEIPQLIEKYGAESLLAMARRKYQSTASAAAMSASAVTSKLTETTKRQSNKRISLVFFTRPCEGTLVECLPGCELDNDCGDATEPDGIKTSRRSDGGDGKLFPPIWAQDYRRVAEEKRTLLDNCDKDSSDVAASPTAHVTKPPT